MQQGGVRTVRSLIAYYSRSGENLVNGVVQYLGIGNTEVLAYILRRFTGADIFRIQPVTDYSENYFRCIDQARQDLQRNYMPPLKEYPKHFQEYQVIYLGYPNYWGTMPMPVYTFLSQMDLSGKIIKPFCTHEGGGVGRSEQEIRKLCPQAQIMEGLPICGTGLNYELSDIEEWAQETNTTSDILSRRNLQ